MKPTLENYNLMGNTFWQQQHSRARTICLANEENFLCHPNPPFSFPLYRQHGFAQALRARGALHFCLCFSNLINLITDCLRWQVGTALVSD
jgi:hypothetical protein